MLGIHQEVAISRCIDIQGLEGWHLTFQKVSIKLKLSYFDTIKIDVGFIELKI